LSTTPTGSLSRPTARLCSRYDDLGVAPRCLHHTSTVISTCGQVISAARQVISTRC
jgi:hypothetical protein